MGGPGRSPTGKKHVFAAARMTLPRMPCAVRGPWPRPTTAQQKFEEEKKKDRQGKGKGVPFRKFQCEASSAKGKPFDVTLHRENSQARRHSPLATRSVLFKFTATFRANGFTCTLCMYSAVKSHPPFPSWTRKRIWGDVMKTVSKLGGY